MDAISTDTAQAARLTNTTSTGRKVRRLSAVLRSLAESRKERLTITEITHAFGDHAFAAVMLVFGLISIASLIPGATFITGAPIVLAAWQVVTGGKHFWMPKKIGDKTVAPADIGRLNARFLPKLRWAERKLAPRARFLFGPIGTRIIGIVCLVLSVIIILPIPGGNMLPGAAVAMLALGLISRDGLAILAGVVTGVGSVVFLIVAYSWVITKVIQFLSNLFGAG